MAKQKLNTGEPMASRRAKNPKTGLKLKSSRQAGMGADQGNSVPSPEPSQSAAASAGGIGPAASAAAEIPPGNTLKLGEAAGGSVATGGLSPVEIDTLRSLAQRLGGVDALIRWLELHRDLK